MRLSLNITNYSWPGETKALAPELTRVVRAADAARIDTVWVADHLIQADPTAVPDSEIRTAVCDVTDEDAVSAAVATAADERGRLQIAVANASPETAAAIANAVGSQLGNAVDTVGPKLPSGRSLRPSGTAWGQAGEWWESEGSTRTSSASAFSTKM